ncbi:MAG: hypothetical protein Fur0025_46890 [Oscillatoriaceae cyanobacterium]
MYSRDNHFRTSVENRAESYYNLGNVFYQQGDLGAAESSYRQAIAYRPNWAIAYYNLAVVLDASGRLEAAESTYRQAISLQPDYVKAYSNLGCVLVKLDKLEEAIEVYQKALAIDSNWATLYNNLGQTLQAQGKPREALSAYTQAIRLQPDMLLPYYNAGKIWQGEGIHSSAVEYFQRCIQLDPNYLVAYAECGYSLMAQRQLEAAMACFQKAIFLQPAFVTAYCHRFLETLPQQSGQNPETDELDLAKIACARFLQALQQSPTPPEVYAHLWQTYVHLGNVLFEYGKYQSAEIYYHNALQIDHNRPEIYGKLSECLAKQNRSRAAMPPDASPILQQGFEAANAHYPQGAANLHPHGVYLAAKDWLVQAKFDGVKYIESGVTTVESNPGNQKLSEADISLPEKCRGLNCAPCLGRINRQFATIHLGNGIYSFDKNRQTVTVDYPRFTAVIPEGRAWIVPQKNSWMICNAIAIITPDNYVLADVSREYPGSLPGCQRHDASKHRVLNLEEFPALEHIDGTVAVLSGLSGNVYFHWLVDVLPRLDILHSSGIKWEEIDYFLINSLAQPFQRETLAALGIPEAKIIESDRHPHIQAKQLLVPSFPGHLGWLQPQALQFLRREFLEKNPPNSSSYPERIYISRAKARYRRVINEAEVIEFLAQFGFQVIETESLSFFAQLAVFERAKIIVAPHGSGLTNIIFCRPGTQVIELVSPHYVRPYYWVISQMLGLEHYYLTGEVFACYPLRELMYQNPLTEDIQVSLSQLSAMMKIAGIIKSNPSQARPTTMPTSVQPETALLQLYRQAEVYLAEGNLEAAEAACRQAVKIQPQSAAAWKILGNIRQAKGQVEEARQCYMKAIELQPNFAAAYANLGSLYAQQQQWDSAIYCYQQAIKIEPKFAGVYRNLAKVWTQLNKSAEAADCSYAALSLEPEKFSAPECVNLGNTLVRYGKMDQGISCYRRALALNPNLVGAYQNLGEALKRQGKLDEAAVYYQKAIELSKKAAGRSSLSGQKQATQNGNRAVGTMAPEDADACIVLAEHYGSKGKWAEAIAVVQKAIALQPKSAAAYKIFGKALQSTGKLEEARQCYLKALQLQPNFAEVHANLGSLSAQQQRWQAAISHYQKALELNPQFAGAYRNLAKVFERSGQPAAAALSWYQALTLEPQAGTAEQYLTVGNAVFQQGKVDEALSCYRRAIELNPNLSQAYHNVGEVLSVIQEWDEAIDAYRQSIEVKPDNAGSHYGLAKALGQLERWEDAVVAYRQVIELNGSSAEIYHQFADALANLQQWEEAASAYRQAIELNQNNSWSYNNLGGALIKLERWEEAVTAYRRAIELNPEFHWSYYNLGDAVAKLGEWDEAVRAYQEAVKLQPDLPWISQKLGDALRERAMSDLAAALGCYRQAIKEHPEDLQNYHKALEIQPNDAELYVQLANGLARQGNSNGAIVFYQMALQLQPDDAGILQQLEELSKKKGVTLPQQKIEIEKAGNLPSALEQAKQFLKSTSQITLDSLLNTSARIDIPYIESPEISIILVLYNRAELTLNCLSSILHNNFKSLELIIVDNASTDNTQLLLKRIQGATILYNSENLHFIRACNQAVERARGEFLLFLNNDTQILGDSIAVAVETLKSYHDIGAVGGKIILPDGTLQEAGSIIWRDGSCLGYGRGNSPVAPEYMFRRSVDYCSAAFLLTRRDLFLGMGGFDEAYLPAYYEETDYCVKLWKAGKRVVYEPNVVLLHYEFASSSSREDATRLQVRNQRIFVEQHKDWLESQYLPNLENILFARTSPKQPGERILFIDDRVPHSFLGSGHPRGNFILSCMVTLGYAVTFYPMDVSHQNEAWAEVYADIPQSVEVMMGYGYPKLAEFLQGRQGYYDAVFVSRPHNMSILKSCLKQNPNLLSGSKIIYDAEALYCLREIEQMRLRGEEPSPEQIEQLIQEEVQLAAGCDRIISVSEQEKQQFVERGLSNTEVLGHAVSTSPTPNPFDKRKDILFVGAIYEMDSPNADSVQWFAKDIFPKIQEKVGGEIELIIAGNNTVENLVEDISQLGNSSIQMRGKVDDLSHLYNNARLFVAPTRFAAGIPLKVYEAAASGIPIVTTSLIAKQLGWEHEVELLVADNAEKFTAECVRLYQDEMLWKKLRQNAIKRVKYECYPNIFSQNLEKIIIFS